MPETNLLSDILRRVAGRGRTGSLVPDNAEVLRMCRALLAERSEAAGLGLARQILDCLERKTQEDRNEIFLSIALNFGVDDIALRAAIDQWEPSKVHTARTIHFAAEPQSQELIRRLNKVPGATARLVAMRGALLDALPNSAAMKELDQDFRHLFRSWFTRGFLEMRRITWMTSAEILEKIIDYEAVHEITGWADLHQRVADPDRRLFAFFHPAMPSEPLIFVQVALTDAVPSAIPPILSRDREVLDPASAKVATFYSISNCQKGLRGISFGNFLIKQVVTELQREFPQLRTFVTLSPVPGFRSWAQRALEDDDPLLSSDDRACLKQLHAGSPSACLAKLAARYLTQAKRTNGAALDPVANFHLGNGALLYKIHPDADPSQRGIGASWGVMVNYLYDSEKIAANHQAYASRQSVIASPAVRSLAEAR
ncbi:malonyl-CoA decarboxylase [Leisingera methylohalidivorans]|uniref:MCD, Malonyl-CoA decarboxylase MCD n=1 Tax=Leisingera methylohalidivorans DSM 14336 TaxID=999552 RepID=V9W1M2_9RHOB|nr:malonyl-CoA decarboxylase [Leisingera methylohalidivorans]AHD03565.1 hypothetical protein METH_22315 [Leisingera methylohalidivorans DSM 14336]